MDAGNQEDQLIVLAYCDKNEAPGEVTTCICYFSMHTLTRADTSGILHCIGDALKQVGVTNTLDSKCVLGVENFPVLKDELEEVVTYARNYLPITTLLQKDLVYTTHLLRCFQVARCTYVVPINLQFTIFNKPSRASVLQLKLIKTNCRTNLHNDTLHALLEICVEGPCLADFNANLYLWRKSSLHKE